MLKLSKITDYGLLVAVYLARQEGKTSSAREIAEFYSLPVPMISKVLKILHDSGIVDSKRGATGGYLFEGDPGDVSLRGLVEALEGPSDLVDCNTFDEEGHAICTIRSNCPSRAFMSGINRAIKTAFDEVTLQDLLDGVDQKTWEETGAKIAGSLKDSESRESA